ncbi:MAG: redox-regulated ATPase YchF [Bacteroidales bacterium]|nr:redox-regulated ATPase YchF [Bacteroidales bacterium]MDZ4204939.1 redox-regulated ATPase YchF [Bacteroidales bacterium]
MPLHCGIVGLANCGKTTLFNCISNTKAQTSSFAFTTNKSNLGVVQVPDQRLIEIDKLIKSAKVVPTSIEVVDIPGLARGSSHGEGIGNSFLSDIRNADALIHVVRCFDDPNLPHIDGSVDPVRDKETLDLELQVKDIESVERKIQRIEKQAKSGDKQLKHQLDVLYVFKEHLENFGMANSAPIEKHDRAVIEDLFLLTDKPVMYVCNVDAASASSGNKYTEAFMNTMKTENTKTLIIAAAAESDIAELDNIDDQMVFLLDMGLEEPGVNKLIRAAHELLELETFFTASSKEVRAWTIHKGTTAPQAAGVIHSDLERGFIRTEVMKYHDFIALKSEHACREAGKFYIEGKNYLVVDGDILHIRFNV